MGKVKAWMMEQEELAFEALRMGMQGDEVFEYVKDNMRGQPIDKSTIFQAMENFENSPD